MHWPGCPSVFGRHQGHVIPAGFSSTGSAGTTGSAYAITAADPRPDDFSQVLNRLYRPAGVRTNGARSGCQAGAVLLREALRVSGPGRGLSAGLQTDELADAPSSQSVLLVFVAAPGLFAGVRDLIQRRFSVPDLRVHNLVVSLDGYASGEGQSLEAAFGHAQQEFMEWFGKLRIWRGLLPDGKLGADEAIASAWGTAIGAEIMGRNKFRPTTGPWPEDGWRGWWGEDPPFHTPCFVMTHYEREPLTAGDTTYHFVSGTPAEVLELAHKAAGDLDVRLGGGPTTINEFLAAGLVDYLHVVQVPIVLGRGVRLWDGLDGLHERYSIETVTVPSGATHLFFTR